MYRCESARRNIIVEEDINRSADNRQSSLVWAGPKGKDLKMSGTGTNRPCQVRRAERREREREKAVQIVARSVFI